MQEITRARESVNMASCALYDDITHDDGQYCMSVMVRSGTVLVVLRDRDTWIKMLMLMVPCLRFELFLLLAVFHAA